VCVSHLGFKLNKVLAESEPAVDLVFGGHWDDSKEATNFVAGTPVLVSFAKGSRVGRIDYWWGDERAYFGGTERGRLKDVSERTAVRAGAIVESLSLIDMHGREGAYEGDLYQIERHNHQVERDQYLAAVKALPPLPEGNLISHYLVPMSAQFRRSELALDAVDRYHERAHEHWTRTGAGKRDMADSKLFAGPEKCVACHPMQHEFWLATRHSRAIQALAATRQDTDPECIGCHTVGYREEGGFNHPGRYADFANVQCGACHGPGGSHLLGGASYIDRGLIVGNGLLGCAKCHEKEHDPKFEERAAFKLMAVACPKIEPPGQGNDNLRFAYRQGARMLESVLEDVPWEVVTDAYLKAGDLADSVAAAERWLAESPKSRSAAFAVADRYMRTARTKEAEGLYRKLIQRNADSANAWIGLGRSVLDRDPAAAVTAGMEAFSLAPGRVESIRLVAEALMRTGRGPEAGDAIGAFLEGRPQDREQLQDLLDELERADG
jgi:tetratricopeptide (TPR) repeat protein